MGLALIGFTGGAMSIANVRAQVQEFADESVEPAPLAEPLLRAESHSIQAPGLPAECAEGNACRMCDVGPSGDGDFAPAPLVPFDWVRSLGFRHSSTDGRHVGRGLPLERSSWLNRPFHVDWFAGPLLTGDAVRGRVGQTNDFLGGLRAGWDFDYYWGLEWRIGWSDPDLVTAGAPPRSGSYMVSDVDVIYYPWGDSRVRPYTLWGLGVAQLQTLREDGNGQEVVLFGMPFGGGVQFAQTRQLTWRLEILDNMAFGSDGLSTQHNLSLTMGMELRLGARPNSYWPWRSGRTVW